MSEKAEVVIIGAGVMGLFTAFFLSELGATGPIVVLEKRSMGAGSTGKSGAILRQHYSHETTVRMAREGLKMYASFPGGHDVGFARVGMCFVCSAADRAALEANVAVQRAVGVEVEICEAARLRELEPRAIFDDDALGAYEPEAAYVDPHHVLAALATLLRERGVAIREGVEVVDVDLARPASGQARVTGVQCSDGRSLEAATVVNAAGPWAARVCDRIGYDAPLSVVRPQQAFFAPSLSDGPERMVFGDLATGLYWKPEPAGWTRIGKLAYADDGVVHDPDDYDEGVSSAFINEVRERMTQRRPGYADAVSWGGCGALYTVTPDAHPLVGPIPGVEGFVLMGGFSGHGFKMAPAVGRGVAAMILGREQTAFEPAFFAVDRFDRGGGVASAYEYGILG